jgi:hypothetical protein
LGIVGRRLALGPEDLAVASNYDGLRLASRVAGNGVDGGDGDDGVVVRSIWFACGTLLHIAFGRQRQRLSDDPGTSP